MKYKVKLLELQYITFHHLHQELERIFQHGELQLLILIIRIFFYKQPGLMKNKSSNIFMKVNGKNLIKGNKFLRLEVKETLNKHFMIIIEALFYKEFLKISLPNTGFHLMKNTIKIKQLH